MNTISNDMIAVDYTKSTFSIEADNLLLKLMGAGLLMLLMLAWISWFFFASLTFYETAQATMQPNGIVTAEFSKNRISRLNYEQAAFFQSQNSSGQAALIPLRIAKIDTKSGKVQLRPLNYNRDQKNTLVQWSRKQSMVGQVKIGVEQMTPATFMLRAAGLIPSSTVTYD